MGALGDAQKHNRYGPDVALLSMEIGGRVSTGGLVTLQRLVTDSAVWGKYRVGTTRAGCTLASLRRTLEATLLRHSADTILRCMGAAAHVYANVGAAVG